MVTRTDIKIVTNEESCDECDDDPEVVTGYYEGKAVYSMCCHDIWQLDEIKDEVIDTCLDIIEEEETKRSLRLETL